MRQLPVFLLLLVAELGCSPGSTEPVPEITLHAMTAMPASAPVAAELQDPLRVEVRVNGTPRPGIRVSWRATGGEVTDAESLTDPEGIATTRWRLGPVAGPQTVEATVPGGAAPVILAIHALPGGAAGILKLGGDLQEVAAAARRGIRALSVQVFDAYDNLIFSPSVTWSVLSGPVAIAGQPSSLGSLSFVELVGTGQEGIALVEARVPGTGVMAQFRVDLVAGPPVIAVAREPDFVRARFRSLQNLSSPAVDTILAGGTIEFRQEDYREQLNSFAVVPMDQPAIPACLTLHEFGSTCRITLSTPGTYRYGLSNGGLVSGIIVVQ